MSVDIERLKVDESLWPDGAKWLIAPKPNNPNNRSFFAKTWNGNSGVKIDGETAHVMFKYWHEPIPRPTKPEWVDGLPPVGCECEVLHLGRTWEKCEIVAHVRSVQGPKAVWQLVGYNEWSGDLADKFRPLQTPEQRQREELAVSMRTVVYAVPGMNDLDLAEKIAKAVTDWQLSKYNLTEK